MKKLAVLTASLFVTSIFGVTSVLGATSDQGGIKKGIDDFLFKRKAQQAVESYTDNTVLKSIDLLVTDIGSLNNAAQSLAKSRDEAKLGATIDAWKKVSATLNQTIIFWYGPVAQYDFNKELAIWPMDKVLVDHTLGEMEAGKITLDAKGLREKSASLRGLNTLKYLLFRDGEPRQAAEITDAQYDYIVAATQAMAEESLKFKASWFGMENMTKEELAVMNNAGFKKQWTSYAEEFKNPGSETSRYFSVSVPLQELIQESMTVVEDMVPQIEELAEYRTEAPMYWESIDLYADLLNQLQGVENSYLGGIEGSRGVSFSELVAMKDEVLDDRIKTAIAATKKRLVALRDAKDLSPEKKEMAIKILASECEKLGARIMTATPLVTADPAVEPFAPYGSDLKVANN